MNDEQIIGLRETFKSAMSDWDVTVSTSATDDQYASVEFTLWGRQFAGEFSRSPKGWDNGEDCPHYITDSESVWQWIAMQLIDQTKYPK